MVASPSVSTPQDKFNLGLNQIANGGGAGDATDLTTEEEGFLGIGSGTLGQSFLSTPINASFSLEGIPGGPVGSASGGQVTVGDIFGWIQSLPSDQLSQVQSDLATAGYYGTMDTVASQPTWGQLGTVDRNAVLGFFKDLETNAKSVQPQSVDSLLNQRSKQFTSQQSAMSKTPIKELGQNLKISNLDPNQARDLVDQASLAVYGHTLPENQRGEYADWLNTQVVNRQMAAANGQINQDNMNKDADAAAQSLIDPSTGKVLGYNMVTATAAKWLGTPYLWGGNGSTPGQPVDCSGLAVAVYKSLGVNLPRTSQAQWQQGTGSKFMDMNSAQPGDLVFFGSDPNAPEHVGIYMGNGMMISAPHTGASVRMDSVTAWGQSAEHLVGFEHFNNLPGATMTGTDISPTQANPALTPEQQAAVAMSGQAVSTSGSSQNLGEYIYQQLKAASPGLSDTQIAGIMGNMQLESSLDPEKGTANDNGQGPGGGLIGWLVAANPGINLAAMQTGDPFKDAAAQVAQLAKEGFLDPQGQAVAGSTVTDVARSWMNTVEKPADDTSAQRGSNGQGILNAINTGGWSTTPGSASLTTGAQSGSVTNLPGAPGGTVKIVDGVPVISTPDTVTQETDTSSDAQLAMLKARMRNQNPDQARVMDTMNFYDMLTKSLHPNSETGIVTTSGG